MRFYPETGSFPKLCNAFPFPLPRDCAFPGSTDCQTVLDQLYRAYAESHEKDPLEIQEGFAKLESLLETLPLDDNNAVWNLCCRICIAYEHKAFIDGFHYGIQLMKELK